MSYDRSRKMTLLCAAKVRSRICVCGKEQLEVAEWCLVSPRPSAELDPQGYKHLCVQPV